MGETSFPLIGVSKLTHAQKKLDFKGQLIEVVLEEGEVNHEQQNVYWDLGPGERPDRVLADMRHVAKKEGIPVKITKGKGNFLVLQYSSKVELPRFTIRRDDQDVYDSAFCQYQD